MSTTFFQVTWTILSTLSLAVFIFTLVWSTYPKGRARLVRLTRPFFEHPIPRPLQSRFLWIQRPSIPRVFIFLLFVYFSISFYHAFISILSWVPEEFGKYDEDGFFYNNVETWAGPFGLFAGLWAVSGMIELAYRYALSQLDKENSSNHRDNSPPMGQ